MEIHFSSLLHLSRRALRQSCAPQIHNPLATAITHIKCIRMRISHLFLSIFFAHRKGRRSLGSRSVGRLFKTERTLLGHWPRREANARPARTRAQNGIAGSPILLGISRPSHVWVFLDTSARCSKPRVPGSTILAYSSKSFSVSASQNEQRLLPPA